MRSDAQSLDPDTPLKFLIPDFGSGPALLEGGFRLVYAPGRRGTRDALDDHMDPIPY
jgi:hypothetical protein